MPGEVLSFLACGPCCACGGYLALGRVTVLGQELTARSSVFPFLSLTRSELAVSKAGD